MKSSLLPLLIGGVLPGIGLGLGAMCQKLAGQHGMATGPFLMVTGFVVAIVGGVFAVMEKDVAITGKAVGFTVMFAIFWGFSSGFISFAMRKLGASLSQIVPLYNMNTLVAVLAAMVLLAEWKTINPTKILVASLLITAGGILASKS